MTPSKLFFGGMPTDPPIRLIREAFPAERLQPGTIVDYATIEALIDCKRGTKRFTTVTFRWRHLVEHETGKIIGAVPGVGFKVLTESEKVDLGGTKLRSAARAARRSFVICSRVDRASLNDEERSRLEHSERLSASLMAAAQIKRKAPFPSLS